MDAFVQEAACAERVVVLKVRVPGRTSLVVVGEGAGITSPELRRELWGAKLPPGFERQRAREEALGGARLIAVGPAAAYIEQAGQARVIRARGGRVVVTDEAPPAELPRFVDLTEAERAALEAAGAALVRDLAGAAIGLRRAEATRALERALQRIDRRREAIRGDLGRIAQADKLAEQAQWLVAEAARAPRGATKLVVTDWSSGEAVPLEIALDPAKDPKDEVRDMFKRAKRLRLGGRIAHDRLAQADAQHARIRAACAAIAEAAELAGVERELAEAKRAAPRDVALPGAVAGAGLKPAKKTRVPYRAFFARSGRRVLVGKGAADNDELTLHVARPHDLWLHAKDRAGAHVVVPLDKGQTCPGDDLVDAAHLAAHFSTAREEKVVDVSYTDRRFVRKPKGSPPGQVAVDREKVVVLRVEAAILRALLEREDL